MLPAILICAFMVKNAATQTVSTSLEITKSCVLIGDDVKLLCTVSSDCCSSQFRIWQKVGVLKYLLKDGLSSDTSKYVEDYDNGTTGFNLIIKNVQKSDLVNYTCQYGLQSSELFLDGILCPSSEVNISGNCWKCAGKDCGWSILGHVIGTVFILIITIVKIGDQKSVLKVVVTFIISAVVNALVAVLIGYFVCHCVDGTDWLLILLGLGTSVITGGIPLIYRLYYGEDLDFWKDCCLHAIIILFTGCLHAIIALFTGSSQGSNGSNEQPLKENKKKKPTAEKSSNEPPLEKKKKKKSAAETGSNEPPLEKKKKKKSAAETGSRSPTTGAKHIKTANNETEMIPTEKGFSGDLEKKRPLPPLTNQPSPTNRTLPLPSSTRPLPSSTRPLPQITTNKGDN